jgi:hypothetical protein
LSFALLCAGFERPPGQNDLDFVLDIASDRGKMKLVGGKRGNTLSPEDLADLNRSLVNIRAGRQKGDDAFAQDAAAEGVEEVLHHGAVKTTTASDPAEARASYGRSMLKRAVVLPTWDTAVVLAARGLQSLLANVSTGITSSIISSPRRSPWVPLQHPTPNNFSCLPVCCGHCREY